MPTNLIACNQTNNSNNNNPNTPNNIPTRPVRGAAPRELTSWGR